MKKMILAVAVLLTACGKEYDAAMDDVPQSTDATQTVTFRCCGFSDVMTRATLEEAAMTDLWALVYASGIHVQTVHQTSETTGFGTVTLTLDKGEHDVYFVASRGDGATLDTDANTITWSSVRDTFWAKVHLVASPPASADVEMSRAVTRLRVTVTDEVPSGVATLAVTPETWYTSLDYSDGTATNAVTKEKTVSVPASYVGTAGDLSAVFWGISGQTEWKTDMTVAAKDADGATISSVAISDAPFIANRTTVYSGRLFSASHTAAMTVVDSWAADKAVGW